MPECDACGDELQDPRDKNLSGWWRDECLPCIGERVPEHGSDVPIAESDEYKEWVEATH